MEVVMDIRPSCLAGQWYPSEPHALARTIDGYLTNARVGAQLGKVWGIIVPHAGYVYSGQVAAHAFACLRSLRPELVVIVSPLHDSHRAPVVTTGHEAYETPLGIVEVNVQAIALLERTLREHHSVEFARIRDDTEHAVEIELPFLQHIIGAFRLLPLMIVDQRMHISEALGQAIAEVVEDRNVLLVASSDLSHFYPQSMANELDAEMLKRLNAFDARGVIEADEDGVGFACGRGAIAAAMVTARRLGANRVSVLSHATSGDVSGDFDSVVGYAAAVILQE
jgi:AmmeMemoRadiSam system protein B